jgi:MFS family permease
MSSAKKLFAGLSVNTFLLAFASLFSDVSSEMLYPVLPVFLTATLGANSFVVGLVSGISEAAQYVVQALSGWISDKMRRRKPVALAGYIIGAVCKPLMGLAPGWPTVLAARTLERLGSGSRSAPRDALIAASADEAHRGKAFGLEGIGDNFGACLGPLLTIGLLPFLHNGLRWVFFLAIIPGLLAVAMILLVRERPVATHAKARLGFEEMRRFPRAYWTYLFVTALFGIGNSTNAFLILRTKDLLEPLLNDAQAALRATILIYAGFNLVAALASYPAGYLSDRFGRKSLLLAAFVVFLVVYAGFAWTTDVVLIGILFAFYGLFQGIFRAVGKALATDFVTEDVRATAVGWYMTTVGLSGLIASLVGGELWERINPTATFWLGAASALLGSVALVLFVPSTRSEMIRKKLTTNPTGL